jgi:hypothetical protein
MRSIYTFLVTFCHISLVPVNCSDRQAGILVVGEDPDTPLGVKQGVLKNYPWFRL